MPDDGETSFDHMPDVPRKDYEDVRRIGIAQAHEIAALRAEVESLRAELDLTRHDMVTESKAAFRAESDLAAVRTDLSVARGCLQRIRDGWVPFYGTWTQRTGSNDPPIEPMSAAEQNEMSGLIATPPVTQLDP